MFRFEAGRRFRVAATYCALLAVCRIARAENEPPRAAVKHSVIVDGISAPPHGDDVLGIARIKFHGLIGNELTDAGFRVSARETAGSGALTLVGLLKEEVCDDQSPAQCRVAIQWQLEDRRGVPVYRATTRAVDQASTFDGERRSLVLGALRSLMQRPRFALQLVEPAPVPESRPAGPLGFRQCRRGLLELPRAARSVAAALVYVQSGSSMAPGAIVSPDGLILTSANWIDEDAPLQVRFTAGQSLPAEVVELDHDADVALVHVQAHTDSTCVPLRDAPLEPGMASFGVGSEPNAGVAISLSGAVVRKASTQGRSLLLQLEAQSPLAAGGPLLDEQGRLAGLIAAPRRDTKTPDAVFAVDAVSAMAALRMKPAAATDPRLIQSQTESVPQGYVRDADDPPYVLSKRYTYGTSPAARSLRWGGAVTAGIGAFGVVTTWFTYRASRNPSASERNRFVVVNDLSWALLGLGAVGVGISYALPEAHDQVAVRAQSAKRRDLFVRVGAGWLELGARL